MMKESIIKFVYEDNPVSFSNDDTIMLNATEMAKPYGKTPKDWLRTDAAVQFIDTLSAVRQISPSHLVTVQKGNSSNFAQGTWMHRDVAIEFARWLSPAFAIWCNDRIFELVKGQRTQTSLPKADRDNIGEMKKNWLDYGKITILFDKKESEMREKLRNKFHRINCSNKNQMLCKLMSPMTFADTAEFLNKYSWKNHNYTEEFISKCIRKDEKNLLIDQSRFCRSKTGENLVTPEFALELLDNINIIDFFEDNIPNELFNE